MELLLDKKPQGGTILEGFPGFGFVGTISVEFLIEDLKEGIVMGVTGALLLRSDFPISCIFAETHSSLPDSRAAAKIIEVLDSYLNLNVDFKPLLRKAEEFEDKLKELAERTKDATYQKTKKELDYFG